MCENVLKLKMMKMEIKNLKKRFFFLSLFVLGLVFLFLPSNFVSADCSFDGENFVLNDNPSQILIPVHRLYNTKNGAYLYTRNVDDANYVLNKWPEFEFTDGIPAFCAYSSAKEGLTPIYRLYNTLNGAYLYTRGEIDRDYVMNKWPEFEFTDGLPSFYASLEFQEGLTPIYRLYNTKNGMYLYTRGEIDRDYVINKWPEFEFSDGIPAFYADTTNDSGPALYKYYGPEIAVGLWNYGSKTALKDNPFKITANKAYNIKNKDGVIVGQVNGSTATRVTYDADSYLKAYSSIADTKSKNVFYFDAVDGDNSSLIFNVYRPSSDYDQYRGKIKIQYTDSSNLWVINTLPMEHYAWGAGEFTGTGPMEHTKTMSIIFRTYGSWYVRYATRYNVYGFTIKSDSGNQIYRGYNWETTYPNVRVAAEATRGVIATHDGDVALTPYSSWSDGRTRSFQERWGSTEYPWCQSVSDPYGKHPTKSTATLEAEGNHMVGLVANGSLHLANEHDWLYTQILRYYYTGITLGSVY